MNTRTHSHIHTRMHATINDLSACSILIAHVVILGASVVGCEYAFIFRHLGAQVRVRV